MMNTGKHILMRYRNRWRTMLCLQILFCALGPALFVYFIFSDIVKAVIVFLSTLIAALLIFRPWKITLELVASYIDKKLDKAQFSTGLLLLPSADISDLARLQQFRVSNQLKNELTHLKPEHHLLKTVLFSSLLVLIGMLMNRYDLPGRFYSGKKSNGAKDIIFRTADTATAAYAVPKLTEQQIKVVFPAYTGLASYTTSDMNVKLLEGSRLQWMLKFDDSINALKLEYGGESISFLPKNGNYAGSLSPETSLLYNFSYVDMHQRSFTSDLYSVQLYKDEAPVIKVEGIDQFTSFELSEKKKLRFTTNVTDDYGLGDIFLVATVGKGSGESIKFREERLEFENYRAAGRKEERLIGNIDLDQLKMEAGDELYFYVQASDLKKPDAGISRSETYFAKIRDTTQYEYGVEGTLGVDLMPDYFRSQRQLIIDTEKLIRDKTSVSKKEFNSRSNELGFDQKALRLKYGQFMGDEADSGIATNIDPEEAMQGDDLLEGYKHDHDSENEHGIVPDQSTEAAEDPLHKYVHDHDDPEEATLFTQSLKTKLRLAMNEMWDAELYLRLFKPERSLPYQYKALRLLEEIKNAARIYVHRIGFDPPPIKEDRRLSGKLNEVFSYNKSDSKEKIEVFPNIRKTIELLEILIQSGEQPEKTDLELFERAGSELAEQAVEFPGKYLNTLQQLKWISEGNGVSKEELLSVQNGLMNSLPDSPANPSKADSFLTDLDELLIKELNRDDN